MGHVGSYPVNEEVAAPIGEQDFDFTTRFSRLNLLFRAIARCFRMKTLLRSGGRATPGSALSALEINSARLACIRYTQQRSFSLEISLLRKGQPVGNRSSLRGLAPLLDAHGVL